MGEGKSERLITGGKKGIEKKRGSGFMPSITMGDPTLRSGGM